MWYILLLLSYELLFLCIVFCLVMWFLFYFCIFCTPTNMAYMYIMCCRKPKGIQSPLRHSYNWNSSMAHKKTNHNVINHDDVIKWKHFPRYWPFVRGIHRSPVNSPHKGQWRVALMFSLICDRINSWVNNREAGDLRRYLTHYDVTVMIWFMSIHRFIIECIMFMLVLHLRIRQFCTEIKYLE